MSTSTLQPARRGWFGRFPRWRAPKPSTPENRIGDLLELARLSRLCLVAARDGGSADTTVPVELTGCAAVLDTVWADFAAELSEFEAIEIRVAA